VKGHPTVNRLLPLALPPNRHHKRRPHVALLIEASGGHGQQIIECLRYRRLHRGINCLFNTASGLNSAVTEHAKILKSLKRRDGGAD